MSQERWSNIIETVFGLAKSGRRDTRSRDRNVAIAGALGELWKSYEVNKLEDKVSSMNIENAFDVARAQKDLIQAQKASDEAARLKNQALPGTDFSSRESIERSFSDRAWNDAITTNPQIRDYAFNDIPHYKSYAAFNKYMNQVNPPKDSALAKQAQMLRDLYNTNVDNIVSRISRGEASKADEIQPFLNQARNMKISFDADNTSLLDILSGNARKRIGKQDINYDQFRTDFITRPQQEARKAMKAFTDKAKTGNREEIQQALRELPANLMLGLEPSVVEAIANSPMAEDTFQTLTRLAESNVKPSEFNQEVNSVVYGVAKPTLTDAEKELNKIYKIWDSYKPDENSPAYPNWEATNNELKVLLPKLAVTSSPEYLYEQLNRKGIDPIEEFKAMTERLDAEIEAKRKLGATPREIKILEEYRNYALNASFFPGDIRDRQAVFQAISDQVTVPLFSISDVKAIVEEYKEPTTSIFTQDRDTLINKIGKDPNISGDEKLNRQNILLKASDVMLSNVGISPVSLQNIKQDPNTLQEGGRSLNSAIDLDENALIMRNQLSENNIDYEKSLNMLGAQANVVYEYLAERGKDISKKYVLDAAADYFAEAPVDKENKMLRLDVRGFVSYLEDKINRNREVGPTGFDIISGGTNENYLVLNNESLEKLNNVLDSSVDLNTTATEIYESAIEEINNEPLVYETIATYLNNKGFNSFLSDTGRITTIKREELEEIDQPSLEVTQQEVEDFKRTLSPIAARNLTDAQVKERLVKRKLEKQEKEERDAAIEEERQRLRQLAIERGTIKE